MNDEEMNGAAKVAVWIMAIAISWLIVVLLVWITKELVWQP